jgi:predicted methyltransferase
VLHRELGSHRHLDREQVSRGAGQLAVARAENATGDIAVDFTVEPRTIPATLTGQLLLKRLFAAFLLLATPIGSIAVAAQPNERSIAAAVEDTRRSDADRDRDETSRPIEVLSFFGLEPGMRVLDVRSGGGYYAEILSYAVGANGGVVAHINDIDEQYHGEEIAKRYRDDRLPNVERLRSNAPDLKLGNDAFDMVLMIMTYHDIYYVSESNPKHPKIDRDHYLGQIQRSLKPGGILAIVDHSAKPGTEQRAAQDLHRIDEAFAKQDIEAAGFVFDTESNALRNPDDGRALLVFDDRIRRQTDRFVYRFIKAKARNGTPPKPR